MQALKAYPQFILVRVTPEGDKIPVDARGEAINPHDPKQWLAYDLATLMAGSSYKLGFVLTAADPFFCVDLDHCLLPDRSAWSPLALEVLNALPGTMVEVSNSGTGLHVWGMAARIPPHKCKNVAAALEFYHEKRFILLGSQQQGELGYDCSALLPAVIGRWFAPGPAEKQTAGTSEWTAVPCAGWSGPDDDAGLIELACSNLSAAATFGGTVAFRDLWEGKEDVLGTVWPGEGRAYDASSADAALAQRLAFWTGKNCERVERLLRQSALMREKYDRADYLRRTILNACARQVQVYSRPTKGDVEVAATNGGWVLQQDMAAVFAGCVYLQQRDEIWAPGPKGGMMKPAVFDVVYGRGRRFMLDEAKTTRSAFEAFTKSVAYRCPVAQGTLFDPKQAPGALVEREGWTYVNIYDPLPVDARPGDVSRIHDLMERLVPDVYSRNVLLAFLACCVQHPGRKITWVPVLQGVEGNGKTTLAMLTARAIGERYSHTPNPQDLNNKFNHWLMNKLFIYINEIYVQDKREVLEVLKPIISDHRIEVQSKGKDQAMVENIANFLLCTNYKDAIPVTADSRRYCLIYTAQQKRDDLYRDGLTPQYFADLYAWLEGEYDYTGQTPGWKHWAHFLKTYDIPLEYHPLRTLRTAPLTVSTKEGIMASLGFVEREIMEQIEMEQPGFAGGWISSAMLTKFLRSSNMSGRLKHNRRIEVLEALGYIPHPALPVKTATMVRPDMCRTRLYVKKGHLALNVDDQREVARMYEDAQVSAVAAAIAAAR